MKLIGHFDDFLTNTVNLNPHRFKTLEERVAAIKDFLAESEYGPLVRSFSAQGSWAHKTIIRPPSKRKEFDADLVVYVNPVPGWAPRDYIIVLRKALWSSDRYRDKAHLKTRCVKIDYAGDFHLDVVPIVVSGGRYLVCSRDDNVFEPTDGDGYATWWHNQNEWAHGQLTKVTRLLKYQRDVKGTFAIKSILLTTLIGERVHVLDTYNKEPFGDVPTALRTIMGRLDDWLNAQREMPDVRNPALPDESFTRKWSPEEYQTFQQKIGEYREWIDDAYGEKNRNASIRKWRRVFDDEFAKGETVEQSNSMVARFAASIQPGCDLVALVLERGRAILVGMPHDFPHVQPPPFRFAERRLPVCIRAHEKKTKDAKPERVMVSGDTIGPNSGLAFRAVQASGLPFPENYRVEWQVVNTDQAAAEDDGLRGGFYRSDSHGCRYERTKYRGVHWVKAFLVNKRTRLVEGLSDRFMVVIR